MYRLLVLWLLVPCIIVLPATVSADGAATVSSTQTFHDVTQMYHAGVDPGTAPFPCGIGTAEVTFIMNGVFHITTITSGPGAGTSWATGTMTGTITLVPDNPSLPTYTGRLTEWFGDNNNHQNGTELFTGNLRLSGSDGSTLTIHGVEHTTVTATGVTLSFLKLTC